MEVCMVIANNVQYAKPYTQWSMTDGHWYYGNGSAFLRNRWLLDDGSWYRFDNDGYMQTGWINENDKWYHLSNSGRMETGWVYDSGKWYYLKIDGSMVTNSWIDSTYFVGSTGAMYVDSITPDGYRVDSSGRWVVGNVVSGTQSHNTSRINVGDTLFNVLTRDNNTVVDYRYLTRGGLGKSGRVKDNDNVPKNLYVYATNVNVDFRDASERSDGNYELRDRYIKELKLYGRANRNEDNDGKLNRYRVGNGSYAHANFDDDNIPVFDTKTAYFGTLYISRDCDVIYYSDDKGKFVSRNYSYFVNNDTNLFSDEQLENALISGIDSNGYITSIFIDTSR